MICKNCGKEIDDDSKFCRYCGQQFQTNEDNEEQAIPNNPEGNVVNQNRKQLLFKAAAIIAIIIAAIFLIIGKQNALSPDEKLCYENAVTMRKMLNDPDTFRLYDSFLLLKKHASEDKGGGIEYTYTIFTCGGSNAYGAIVKSEEVFKDKEYLGTSEEIEATTGLSEDDPRTFARLDFLMVQISQNLDGSYDGWDVVEVDAEKIKKKLKLK